MQTTPNFYLLATDSTYLRGGSAAMIINFIGLAIVIGYMIANIKGMRFDYFRNSSLSHRVNYVLKRLGIFLFASTRTIVLFYFFSSLRFSNRYNEGANGLALTIAIGAILLLIQLGIAFFAVAPEFLRRLSFF